MNSDNEVIAFLITSSMIFENQLISSPKTACLRVTKTVFFYPIHELNLLLPQSCRDFWENS